MLLLAPMAKWTCSAKGRDFTQDTYERERGKILTSPSGHHVGAKLTCSEGRLLGLNTCLRFSWVVWFITPTCRTCSKQQCCMHIGKGLSPWEPPLWFPSAFFSEPLMSSIPFLLCPFPPYPTHNTFSYSTLNNLSIMSSLNQSESLMLKIRLAPFS